jgi:hypothetical protein
VYASQGAPNVATRREHEPDRLLPKGVDLSFESVCETWEWPRVGPKWGSGGGFEVSRTGD